VLKKMLSSFLGFGKKPAQDKKSDFKIEDDDEEGRDGSLLNGQK
jgi:hypothetical protein